jgi:hypothetical protein
MASLGWVMRRRKIWPLTRKRARMEAYAFQCNFCRIVSVYIQLGI